MLKCRRINKFLKWAGVEVAVVGIDVGRRLESPINHPERVPRARK
jgi:L-fucose isomerase-like protein